MPRPAVARIRSVVAAPRACYEFGMHEALWVVIAIAGFCGLLFVLDLLGIVSTIFTSTRNK